MTNYGWTQLEDDGRRAGAVRAKVGWVVERCLPQHEWRQGGWCDGKRGNGGEHRRRRLCLAFGRQPGGQDLRLFVFVCLEQRLRIRRGVVSVIHRNGMAVGMRVDLTPIVVLCGMATIEMRVDKRGLRRGARERQ